MRFVKADSDVQFINSDETLHFVKKYIYKYLNMAAGVKGDIRIFTDISFELHNLFGEMNDNQDINVLMNILFN